MIDQLNQSPKAMAALTFVMVLTVSVLFGVFVSDEPHWD